MKTIREYSEDSGVKIVQLLPKHGESLKNVISKDTYKSYVEGRWVIKASSQGSVGPLEIDLLDVFKYVKENIPEICSLIGK